jgi:hypothetical protein
MHHTIFRLAVWGAFLLVPAILPLGYHYRERLAPGLRRLYYAFVIASMVTLGRLVIKQASWTVREPPEWDLRAFWIYGRVAATGGNYYSPEAMHRVGDRLGSSTVFNRDVLDVGFPYPPPTMLLIAPLGYLDVQRAAIAWQTVSLGSLIASTVLLWRIFLPASGALGVAVTATLMLSFGATLWNVQLTQSNLLVLLLVTLLWAARDRLVAGVLLALGTAVKPVVAFLGLYWVLRGKWKASAIAIGAYVVLALLAVALFGWTSFSTYFVSSPLSRMSGWAIVGHISQSLLATVLRARGVVPTSETLDAPWFDPLFVIVAVAVLTGTLLLMHWVLRFGGELGSELALAIMMPTALLLYPNTLHHYTTLLLLPLVWMWARAAELAISPLIAAGIIAASYWLVLVRGGLVSILAIGLVWCTLSIFGLRLIRQPRFSNSIGHNTRPAPAQ